MDDMLLPLIFVALSVGLLAWGLTQLMAGALDGQKKKLQQRLSGEGRAPEQEPAFAKAIRREIVVPGFSGKLVKLPGMESIHAALEKVWPKLSLAVFLGAVVGLALTALVIAWAFLDSMLLAAAVAGVVGALPVLLLSARRGSFERTLADQLPEALDFLSRILRAGHSLSTGLQMMSEELPQPLSGEFRRCYDAHSLGLPLEEALKDTAVRVASTDFGFFVTAVLIQRQTGGDLSEVLNNISGMIRSRIRLQQHVKAKTAEGRFTGYILVAFPIIMFLISYALNPKYASVLLHGTGLYLLGGAGALCLLGLYCIRKITTVKV